MTDPNLNNSDTNAEQPVMSTIPHEVISTNSTHQTPKVIQDEPLFLLSNTETPNPEYILDQHHRNSLNSNTPGNLDIINQTPIVVSPASTTSSRLSINPLNPDSVTRASFPNNSYMLGKEGNGSEVPESYTLSNYYEPQSGNKLRDSVPSANKDQNWDRYNNSVQASSKKNPSADSKSAVSTFKKPKQKKLITAAPNKRPAFVSKLWKMINDPENSKYISWLPNGEAFQVNYRENFMKYVLPKYFKHNNFTSFVRQLNTYGWHKMQDANAGSLVQTEEVWNFENPNFKRDREDLLDNIVRNKPSKDNEDEEVDIKDLLDQLEQMKRTQALITEDLRRVRQDNEMLWKENFIARERHKIQTETLDKIMRFLASVYGNNTSNLIEQINNNSANNELVHQQYGYQNPSKFTNPQNMNSNSTQNIGQDHPNAQVFHKPNGYHQEPQEKFGSNQQQQLTRQNRYQSNQQFINSPSGQQFMGSPSSQQFISNPYNTRRQLMITNNMNDSYRHDGSSSSSSSRKAASPNELRINNMGTVPTASENRDSSIQVIHRGPENRNLESYRSSNQYVQHVPDYIGQPRQFKLQQPKNYGNNDNDNINQNNYASYQRIQQIPTSSSSSTATPNNPVDLVPSSKKIKPQLQPSTFKSSAKMATPYQQENTQFSGSTVPNKSTSAIPMSKNSNRFSDSPTTRTSNNSEFNGFSSTSNDQLSKDASGMVSNNPGTPVEIMGNIQQRLHRNQSTLKQANEWLNKYSDNMDSIPPNDDFKVEDFLQQPLELSNIPTPIDFNSVDAFLDNDNTPAITPLLSAAQLNNPPQEDLDYFTYADNPNSIKRAYSPDNLMSATGYNVPNKKSKTQGNK